MTIPLQKLLEASAEHLSEEERFHFADLLKKYQDIFAVSKKDHGRTNLVKYRINTGTALPVRKPPRRLPLGKRQTEKEEINNMLERGVIQASTSPWASPVVLVTKKDRWQHPFLHRLQRAEWSHCQGCLPTPSNWRLSRCPQRWQMVLYNGPNVRLLADRDGAWRWHSPRARDWKSSRSCPLAWPMPLQPLRDSWRVSSGDCSGRSAWCTPMTSP